MPSITEVHPFPWKIVEGVNRHGRVGAAVVDAAGVAFVHIRSPEAVAVANLLYAAVLAAQPAQEATSAGPEVPPGAVAFDSAVSSQTITLNLTDLPLPAESEEP